MAQITQAVRDVLEKAEMWVLATANLDNTPNAVPINFVKVLDDKRILLVDNMMKKTRENIAANPKVAVTVWHEHDGYQLKGKAHVETSGAYVDEAVATVQKVLPHVTPKGVVIVDVDTIYITSPGPDNGKLVE